MKEVCRDVQHWQALPQRSLYCCESLRRGDEEVGRGVEAEHAQHQTAPAHEVQQVLQKLTRSHCVPPVVVGTSRVVSGVS